MGIQAKAEVKFALIEAALLSPNNLLSVTELCKIACVSRSGFYRWQESKPTREQREKQDQADFELILEAYNFRGYAKGARSIYMRLLHVDVLMNLKKIRRLMHKYKLICPIRRINPYKQMMREMRTNTVAPNAVNREFLLHGARKILLTDITYLFYRGGNCCYLSTILDAFTREILAYRINESLEVTFVLNTVEMLMNEYGAELDDETIVHSDQGCHYTSKAFIRTLKEANIVQSMSAKGVCWDNAPQESFFGHMKDEIATEISKCESFKNVKEIVDDWMDYYNNDRYQWDLLKLSPREYYKYTQTGVYPLKKLRYEEWVSAPNPEV